MANEMRRRSWIAIAALLLAACAPATDRDQYEAGESGTVTFRNQLGVPLYLAGCNHFDYEKRVGGDWISQGSDLACFWEGNAQPVAPGDAVVDAIHARAPGTWRLRYDVGAGCSDTAPLGEDRCDHFATITSNEFEVVASTCLVTGCSGELCSDEPLVSSCIWRPENACYRSAHCGHVGPDATCGWEPTDALAACLASPPP